MSLQNKIIAFVIYSVVLFGAGWSLHPAKVEEKSVAVAAEAKKEDEVKDVVASKKTTFNPNGSVLSVENFLSTHDEKKKEEQEIKIVSVEKIVTMQPKLLISAIQSYNFHSNEFNYQEFAISYNVMANVYAGVGYEQRSNESIIKTTETIAF